MSICLDQDDVRRLSSNPVSIPESLLDHKGWSPYSGSKLDTEKIQSELLSITSLGSLPFKYPRHNVNYLTKYSKPKSYAYSKPGISLFGLGNYAKTIILPYIYGKFYLNSLHELDPTQISSTWFRRFSTISTSPYPHHEDFDSAAWFIASYHHMHACVAEEALMRGIIPIIEKPLFTTTEQLHSFKKLLHTTQAASFFSCFQKRYQLFNSFIYDDLEVKLGQPINMNASVYEIPLPKFHWYNWPNSHSRIISNACHWIDYFLFINDYTGIHSIDRYMSSSAGELISIVLVNSAQCLISITDFGSSRLGVREHIELRTRHSHCVISDSYSYVSENRTSVIRRVSVNPLSAHKNMYRTIARRIRNKLPGDNSCTLLSSEVALMLDLLPSLR
jgi:predicted dehydrogenase